MGGILQVDTIQNNNTSNLITQTNVTTITIGASGQTVALPSQSISYAAISNAVDFRNIVINGDMQIAQRSTSVASITTSDYYTLDRFTLTLTTLGTWTMSQSTDVPSGYGFANSLKLDCTTADASPAAGDRFLIRQSFEGQNLQYLKKGTANALPLTASFWVKSTKTGTFICELADQDNTRSISKSYTVNTTNTWEFKTVTFAGDTTGALDNDNARSLDIQFWLGAGTTWASGTLNTSWGTTVSANRAVGQVNIADSTSNDFLITGVQLEAGEQASGFEFMPIDADLGRCQRYYYKTLPGTSGPWFGNGVANSTTEATGFVYFNQQMRSSPTALEQTGTAANYAVNSISAATACSSVPVFSSASPNGARVDFTVASGLTGGQGIGLRSAATTAYLAWSAEL